jgi:endoribonuclease Dicer
MLSGKGSKEYNGGHEHVQHLRDKTIADVCEALIGAAFVHYYEPGNIWMPDMFNHAVRAVTTFANNENHAMQSWADYQKAYELPAYQTEPTLARHRDLVAKVDHDLGYRFKYPRLLQSAFCHPSFPFSREHTPSYQRLEFLGDALLDTACVTHLFYRYPTKDPQWLTEHKMAMVANKFLGALCVKLGFHRHLRHNHSQLLHQVHEYVTEVQEAMRTAGDAVDYWIHVKDPPKCLPDIVEAYVGALFIDSDFDYNEVQKFFDRHMKPYFEDMTIYDTFANNHPVTHLHTILTTNYGCQNYALMAEEMPMESPGFKSKIIAGVIVHQIVLCHSVADSGRYAKMRVCEKALGELEGLAPFEFRAKFDCDCVPPREGEATELADFATAAGS